MSILSAVSRWWNGLFSNKSIEKAFGIKQIAVTELMLKKQELYRSIVRGEAYWNNEDTPSLMLAGSISAEVARKVTVGLVSEIAGSARAEYLNEHYSKVKEILRTTVIAACNGGEIIFKPYMTSDGLEVTLSETECYWPIAYNERDELTDVAFGASIQRDSFVYKLLERHTFEEATQTHEIKYSAFRSKREAQQLDSDEIGDLIDLADVPEWGHLQDITITEIEKPLFVHFMIPTSDTVETPQRQGLPIWSKAIELLRKADQQESRTDWEFEGAEFAVDVPNDWFRKDKNGNPILPKGKERRFRLHENRDGNENSAQPYNPDFRIDGLNTRTNQILRRIEFLCGLSYGILSDVSVQEKTATEVSASKDRFFTTVSDIQQALQKVLEHLIYSFNILADLQTIPQGVYEVSFTWDDSIMADRPREFEERIKAQSSGWLSPVENRAWWLGVDVDSEEAQKVPEVTESEF